MNCLPSEGTMELAPSPLTISETLKHEYTHCEPRRCYNVWCGVQALVQLSEEAVAHVKSYARMDKKVCKRSCFGSCLRSAPLIFAFFARSLRKMGS